MIHESLTPKNQRDTWRTPIGIYKYANMVWGPFDVDLAATDKNTQHPIYIDREKNSLRQNWREYGTKGWLNPPYSNITPWIEKAIKESERGFSTVMLIPTLNGEARDSLIIENAATLMFIIGRVAFINQYGNPVKGNPRGSMYAWFASGYYGKRPAIDSVYRSDIIQWK